MVTIWCPPRWSLYHGTIVRLSSRDSVSGDVLDGGCMCGEGEDGAEDGNTEGKNMFFPFPPRTSQGIRLRNDEQAAAAAAFSSFRF